VVTTEDEFTPQMNAEHDQWIWLMPGDAIRASRDGVDAEDLQFFADLERRL
jgi:hypothetical protein